jgi:predicted glycoside hydrolase/deacetylase ChbG (UPF0249 family)
MRRVVLCADDFGQGAAVDAGILRLVEMGRLTAVSCLVGGPTWEVDGPSLLARAEAVDLGLHLDLTDGAAAAPPVSLARLVVASYARRLDPAEVERRIGAQLDAFERVARRPPAFVDGHRHVHQLPVVREALLRALRARYGPAVPLVRCTVPRRWRGAKALVIAALGGFALRRRLRREGVPHNPDFAGVYAFDPRADYPALVRRWLAGVADGAIILCHPGLPDGEPGDPIAEARAAELRYLESSALSEDCARAGVRVGRFGDLPRG